jgi:hypothetical protein
VDVDEDKVWNGVAAVSAIVAVRLSKPLVERVWRVAFRREPPGNPAAEDVTWRDALLWALLTGAIVGVVRLTAQRAAAGAWATARGSYPKALASTRP